MREHVKKRIMYWTCEIRRLWVPLLTIALIAWWRWQLIDADPTSSLARTLTKINTLFIGAVIFHIVRRQMFPYLNFGTLLNWLKDTATPLLKSKDPIKVLGACILIGCAWLGACILLGLLASAIIPGFTRGL